MQRVAGSIPVSEAFVLSVKAFHYTFPQFLILCVSSLKSERDPDGGQRQH